MTRTEGDIRVHQGTCALSDQEGQATCKLHVLNEAPGLQVDAGRAEQLSAFATRGFDPRPTVRGFQSGRELVIRRNGTCTPAPQPAGRVKGTRGTRIVGNAACLMQWCIAGMGVVVLVVVLVLATCKLCQTPAASYAGEPHSTGVAARRCRYTHTPHTQAFSTVRPVCGVQCQLGLQAQGQGTPEIPPVVVGRCRHCLLLQQRA